MSKPPPLKLKHNCIYCGSNTWERYGHDLKPQENDKSPRAFKCLGSTPNGRLCGNIIVTSEST